jgi:NitT/TauT family transport system ATP-binding protein
MSSAENTASVAEEPTSAGGGAATVAVGVDRVSKSFAGCLALQSVSLAIRQGEFVAIIGPSGCGKTTLLRILAGLESASEGAIQLQGRSIAEARANQDIGIAFQQPALIPSLTARQNVQTTLDLSTRRSQLGPEALLGDFGLADFIDHYPHQLSGGMQQRVNIGCAMVHQPRLLLLDEPFGALDEMTRASMCRWLAKVLQTSGQTTVLVTHSIEEAVLLSDRIIVLAANPGRVAEILAIDLPRPRTSWEDDSFIETMKRVRRALKTVDPALTT